MEKLKIKNIAHIPKLRAHLILALFTENSMKCSILIKYCGMYVARKVKSYLTVNSVKSGIKVKELSR